MSTQRTLTGDETDEERSRPKTMRYCEECDEWLLRSTGQTHEHDLVDDPDAVDEQPSDESDPDDEPDEEPEQVGNWFTVTMNYAMEYRVTVPAYDEQHAKEMAKEKRFGEDGKFTDGFHVHTAIDKERPIFEDDDEASEYNLLV